MNGEEKQGEALIEAVAAIEQIRMYWAQAGLSMEEFNRQFRGRLQAIAEDAEELPDGPKIREALDRLKALVEG